MGGDVNFNPSFYWPFVKLGATDVWRHKTRSFLTMLGMVIIALLVLALAMIVLVFIVNRGRIGLSFGDIGGTALASGLLLTLGAGLAKILPGLWQKICGGQELAAALGGGVLIHNLLVSLIVFGAGLVLAVLGRLIRGKKKKEEPAEPVEE